MILTLLLSDAAAVEGESDMDLDLLAESDTDNESVHGGSVHSVGPYEDNTDRVSNRNTSNRPNTSERKLVLGLVCKLCVD